MIYIWLVVYWNIFRHVAHRYCLMCYSAGHCPVSAWRSGWSATETINPVKAKHLYNFFTMLAQRRRHCADVILMLYKCSVSAGCEPINL